jgi:hypothetical protein
MKSGNLNFLEPSGQLQTCKWTAAFTVEPLFNRVLIFKKEEKKRQKRKEKKR